MTGILPRDAFDHLAAKALVGTLGAHPEARPARGVVLFTDLCGPEVGTPPDGLAFLADLAHRKAKGMAERRRLGVVLELFDGVG